MSAGEDSMDNRESQSAWNEDERRIMAAFQRKDFSEANNILIKALKKAQLLGQLQPGFMEVVNALAVAYCLERRYADAEHLYTSLLKVKEKILGPNHPDIVDSLEKLAIVMRETQGNSTLAKTIAFRARSLANCQA